MRFNAHHQGQGNTVAVILSGCGFLDGSEIHESVAVLMHLARHGASWHCFAPNIEQANVVDHLTGQVEERRQRNILHESARIARGKDNISPLATLDVNLFDALILPGGFGAAKNLCTFAVDGEHCTVLPDVERILKMFYAVEKPIGMCCIAPVIAAKVFGKALGGPGLTLTVGEESEAADAVRKMGNTHTPTPVTGVCVDPANAVVTTPAYMFDATPHEVYIGVGRMVDEVLRLAQSAARKAAQPAVSR